MENRNSFACPICGNTDIHSRVHKDDLKLIRKIQKKKR